MPPLAERVYRALVLGTRDYVEKNGFTGVVLGLSGGVDSALTLAIAVDALGAGARARRDDAVALYVADEPSRTRREQARRLGVRYDVLSIEPMFETTLRRAGRTCSRGCPRDATEENIQARCRGVLLMAISNKTRRDAAHDGQQERDGRRLRHAVRRHGGGFAPLKDCTKTLVYQLARYRNTIAPVIPQRVITRAPTAELRDNQKDSDSLPPYDVLDAILEEFIEKDHSVDQIAALGFDRATVVRVLQMVKRAEYKRRQAPPGVRVSNRAFGRDWRYPITSGY